MAPLSKWFATFQAGAGQLGTNLDGAANAAEFAGRGARSGCSTNADSARAQAPLYGWRNPAHARLDADDAGIDRRRSRTARSAMARARKSPGRRKPAEDHTVGGMPLREYARH